MKWDGNRADAGCFRVSVEQRNDDKSWMASIRRRSSRFVPWRIVIRAQETKDDAKRAVEELLREQAQAVLDDLGRGRG